MPRIEEDEYGEVTPDPPEAEQVSVSHTLTEEEVERGVGAAPVAPSSCPEDSDECVEGGPDFPATSPSEKAHRRREKLREVKKRRKWESVWKGPEEDGITFSLLSRFLVCRERFRVLVCEGLKPADRFNHRIEYGQMWHVCEEALARGPDPTRKVVVLGGVPYQGGEGVWEGPLLDYARKLAARYPMESREVDHWHQVCRAQFPAYVEHWSKHPDVLDRRPLLQETAFSVPYELPSGRVVRLRGKWDSVDLIGKGKAAGVYLQENKTKGDIDEGMLQRQLTFDLQTMLYLAALSVWEEDGYFYNQLSELGVDLSSPNSRYKWVRWPIKGVRYNVVRRPLSGGKGNISRHKASAGSKCPKCKGDGFGGLEVRSGDRTGVCLKCGGKGRVGGKPEETREHFYGRLRGLIDGTGEDAPGPEHFFMRWKVEVTPGDLKKFRRETLDPILEQLWDWWEWVSLGGDPFDDRLGLHRHWRHPFGVFNPLDEGGASDLDDHLMTGSTLGLEKTADLFPELGGG